MENPTYNSSVYAYLQAHRVVVKLKGRAKTHTCVMCDNRADHWSYNHTDPNPLRTDDGRPYSNNPDHYRPRCATCHQRFDAMQRILAESDTDIHALEAELRNAVAQQRKARSERDLQAYDYWRNEVDRLVVPLEKWRPIPST